MSPATSRWFAGRHEETLTVLSAESAAKPPKKGRSAYIFYTSETRLTLPEEQRRNVASAAKVMGAMWKALGDGEKVKYNEMAAEDKLRYEREMAAAGLPTSKAASKGPKKPRSAYILYTIEARKQLAPEQKKTVGDAAKVMGAAWSSMGEAEKSKYQAMAVEDKGRYAREMAAAGQ